RHETLGALGPLDDVDLFAAELVHDRLDAQSALADAGASRVEAGLTGAHGDLRAGAGLAGDADDLDLPVEDLRDFELEESLHERLVRPTDDDLRAAERAAHLEHDDLARLSGEVALVRRLLGARQDRGGPAIELHDRGAGFEVADLRVDDVALAVRVLREDLLALRLAQRLLAHLFGGELRETGHKLSVHFGNSPLLIHFATGDKKSGVDPLSVPDAASGQAGSLT